MAAVTIDTKAVGVLAAVSRGRVEKAPRILLYAREKIGKTAFAAGAPNPIFLCSEVGTEEYDVARAPITRWHQALELVDALIHDPHDFRTVVIDTLDHLEALLHRHIVLTDSTGGTSMVTAAGGSGNAFEIATEAFRKLAAKLDVLTERRRMTIVLLAQAHGKTLDDESDGGDRYRLKTHEEAAAFWKEWVDAVFFANRASTGERFLSTVPPRSGAWDAGTRWALPAQLPLRWSAFDAAVKASAALRNELATLLPRLPNDMASIAAEEAREANDPDALRVLVDRVRQSATPTTGLADDGAVVTDVEDIRARWAPILNSFARLEDLSVEQVRAQLLAHAIEDRDRLLAAARKADSERIAVLTKQRDLLEAQRAEWERLAQDAVRDAAEPEPTPAGGAP